MNQVNVKNLGTMPFLDTLKIQENALARVKKNEQPDTLFFVEHPHVYSLGSETNKSNLLFSEAQLKEKGIELVEVNRGGDITYHGYGQLVIYPILNLHHYYLDAHRYLRDLEEVVIQTLNAFAINATRKQHPNSKKNYTGVWVGDEKICAIGVKFSSWSTMHGLALNLNTDLTYFDGIIPCGISEMGVTSLNKILQKNIDFAVVINLFLEAFRKVFDVEILSEKPIIKP